MFIFWRLVWFILLLLLPAWPFVGQWISINGPAFIIQAGSPNIPCACFTVLGFLIHAFFLDEFVRPRTVKYSDEE